MPRLEVDGVGMLSFPVPAPGGTQAAQCAPDLARLHEAAAASERN